MARILAFFGDCLATLFGLFLWLVLARLPVSVSDPEYVQAEARAGGFGLVVFGVVGCIAAVASWQHHERPPRRHGRAVGLARPLGLIVAVGLPLLWLLGFDRLYETLRPEPPPLLVDQGQVPGQAWAATSAAAEPFWSGAVTCQWREQGSLAIDYVTDLAIPITDSTWLASEGLTEGRITNLFTGGRVEYAGVLNGVPSGVETRSHRDVRIKEMSPDGRTGTAIVEWVSPAAEITWSCRGGP